MLQQILEHIHNMFIKSPNPGTYTITGGTISLPFIKEGQRIWIVGSDLNDGVYTYHADGINNDDDISRAGLHDETFAGTICALAVPPAVIALSEEISAWVDQNKDAVNSPYQSESWGGYSYTKATSKNGKTASSWEDIFAERLNPWRKISI